MVRITLTKAQANYAAQRTQYRRDRYIVVAWEYWNASMIDDDELLGHLARAGKTTQ